MGLARVPVRGDQVPTQALDPREVDAGPWQLAVLAALQQPLTQRQEVDARFRGSPHQQQAATEEGRP